jgi:hypothetical protein
VPADCGKKSYRPAILPRLLQVDHGAMENYQEVGSEAVASDDVNALIGVCGGETRSAPLTGVRALMLAILQDGIQAYLGRQPRARTEAEVWILSGRRHVFSFDVICESLGLEPDWMRGVLRRLREQNVSARAIGRLRPNVRTAGMYHRRRSGRRKVSREGSVPISAAVGRS